MITYGFYWFLLACEGVAVVLLTIGLVYKLKALRQHF